MVKRSSLLLEINPSKSCLLRMTFISVPMGNSLEVEIL